MNDADTRSSQHVSLCRVFTGSLLVHNVQICANSDKEGQLRVIKKKRQQMEINRGWKQSKKSYYNIQCAYRGRHHGHKP